MTNDEIIQKLITQTNNDFWTWKLRDDHGGELWYATEERAGVWFKFRPLAGRSIRCFDYTYLTICNQHISDSPEQLEPLHEAIKRAVARNDARVLAKAVEKFAMFADALNTK